MFKSILCCIAIGSLCVNVANSKSFQNEVSEPNESHFQRGNFDFGLNGGLSFPFTDVSPMVVKPAFELMGGYYFNNGLSVHATLLKGWMTAGLKNAEEHYFRNNYWAENLILRFNPMAIWRPQSHAKLNFYVGAGVSLVQSNTKGQSGSVKTDDYNANYHGQDILIPAEIGLNVPLANVRSRSDSLSGRFLVLNINYRNYFGFTDNMDGYEPPAKFNKHNDGFSIFSLGLAFIF